MKLNKRSKGHNDHLSQLGHAVVLFLRFVSIFIPMKKTLNRGANLALKGHDKTAP